MGFSFGLGEPKKPKILKKKLSSYLKKKKKKKKQHFLMTYHLIGNNLRKKELVVIETKQKLQHNTTPFHFCTFNVIHFKKSVYELQYYVSKCFVMLKIYALELCDQILQTKS